MFGHNVFERMMNEVINPSIPSAPYKKITQLEFDEWQKHASFDIMKGLRYGQSFCNYFGVTDNILYYEFSWLNAEEYIRRAYIERT
jgi:hypothetical protein